MKLRKKLFVHSFLATLILASTTLISSCGTILHPERAHKPHTGKLDVEIVILDGIGLFFFLIPGVIAFAVDFSTGAIYLPKDGDANLLFGENGLNAEEIGSSQMAVIKMDKEHMTKADIEKAIEAHTGRSVDIDMARIKPIN